MLVKVINLYKKKESIYFFYISCFFGLLTTIFSVYDKIHPEFPILIPFTTFIIHAIFTLIFILKKDKN
jgi:hypothetical protein